MNRLRVRCLISKNPLGASSNPDEENVRDHLKDVLASPTFAGSRRLQKLLRYLVEQKLQGNGDKVLAKSVGMDLYGYDADEIDKKANVVRVDAGRVRKKLAEFYAAEGDRAAMVIDLPIGRYVPEFRAVGSQDSAHAINSKIWHLGKENLALLIGVVLALVSVITLIWSLTRTGEPHEIVNPQDRAQRAAIFDDSPARLRAMNLADQGRDLIFPAVDVNRLDSALQIFKFAIEEDPDYFGAHAGAAQVHATKALLSGDSSAFTKQIELAQIYADTAKFLAPGAAWSLSAQAWIDFAQGNDDTALRLSQRATHSDPGDLHLVEFDTLIALFNGEFDRVEQEVNRILPTLRGNAGYVFTNALGSALYHQGDYQGTVTEFESAIANGGPTGPISIAYLMAAHYRLGNAQQASELAETYERTFPGRRVDLLLSRLYRNPDFGADLSEAMRGAGY